MLRWLLRRLRRRTRHAARFLVRALLFTWPRKNGTWPQRLPATILKPLAGGISVAYAVRRNESVEKAEAILLQAQIIHPKVAMIAFNLARYASVTGRMEEAKERLRHAIELDKDIRGLALDDEDLKPLWGWIAGLSNSSRFQRALKTS